MDKISVENKYRGIPFWSWNDKLDKNKLLKQIDFLHQTGFGGFFMHARAGLKTEYLSKEWFDLISACTDKAQELGLSPFAYDENGWPSGFAGGLLTQDENNLERYLTYDIAPYSEKSFVSYKFDKGELVRTRKGKRCLNIYLNVSKSTVDILNPEVVKKFIDVTHKRYKNECGNMPVGFFTDEPQVCAKGIPFSNMISEYFVKNYNMDVLDGLGLLFVKKKGYRDFRYKYYSAVQHLMLNSFGKQIYEWCEENGVQLTGHYYEERSMGKQMLGCAGVMPFYEYMHIPGIDYLGGIITEKELQYDSGVSEFIVNELAPKQLGSVAAQLGKKQTLTETGGMCGWHFSPNELKGLLEYQYVNGVNLNCLHLFPYSEIGQRKRDYPPHFSYVNPWVNKGLRDFNDYFALLGKILSESEEIVRVGVIHPLKSAYFSFDRSDKENNSFGVSKLDESFIKLIEKLGSNNVPHHYIDETILSKHGKVENNVLKVGNCKYDYIILPYIHTLEKTTERFLREYVDNGGKILLFEGKPKYLEGERYDFDYLKSNVTFKEIRSAQPYSIKNGGTIRSSLRVDGQGREFIYAFNVGDKVTVKIDTLGCTSFKSFNLLKNDYEKVGKTLTFEKFQSYILYFSDELAEREKDLLPLYLDGSFSVATPTDNYCTLDFLSYSLDGVHYSKKLYHMAAFDELLKARHFGKVYLKYSFKLNNIPNKLKVITEDNNILSFSINGAILNKRDKTSEDLVYTYDLKENALVGVNDIVICVDYHQNENVYKVLFDKNAHENLRNCMVYDTTIESIYLLGDFGVFGDFEDGDNPKVIIGKSFYIGSQKKEVSSLIRDGFPFFRGDIRLTKRIKLDRTNYSLNLGDDFHVIELTVNGKFVGKVMFGNSVDISEYLVVGENVIELVVTVGNRNLLGVLHSPAKHKYFTTISDFEMFGHWNNGESSKFCKDYAFLKNFI